MAADHKPLGLSGCYGKRMGNHTCEYMLPSKIERESIVKLELYYLRFGKDQEIFQTNQSISQFFVGLHWVLPLTIYFLDLWGPVSLIQSNPFPKLDRQSFMATLLAPTVHTLTVKVPPPEPILASTGLVPGRGISPAGFIPPLVMTGKNPSYPLQGLSPDKTGYKAAVPRI